MRHLRIIFALCCLIGLVALSACGESASSTAGRVPQGDTGPQLAATLVASPTPGQSSTHPWGVASPGAGQGAGSNLPVGALPSSFPHYFSFGVLNAPHTASALDEMRSENGTAFAFRYEVLSGTIDAQAVLQYMQESAWHKYTPAFIFDRLAASQIDDATFMRGYYTSWETLLRQVKIYGKPVVVMVEPTLWEELERASNGNDATQVAASVLASGYPDAQYPDTAQGLAQTLLHMRDLYARNAVLALPVSSAVGDADVATDQRPDLDVTTMAQDETHFLKSVGLSGNPAGVSTWDVLAGDLGGQDAANHGTWWDSYDRTFPNFVRYLSFIGQISQQTQRRVVLWQVPEGNQYYTTMNNTPGHYQDNRVAYILTHVPLLVDTGVVAVLFGPKDSDGTAITNVSHDGVVNSLPVNSYECNRCNTHISHYADDDGGFLRIFIGIYMAHPALLS
ncbi:MAG TPA: hypothetical protein VH593_15860 [Ktedonobacteraceae bacterium]